MKRIVQFSGGKDSTALVLWAREQFGADGFTAVFCDTGHEAPETYAFIEHVNVALLGGRLVTIRSEKYPNGMRDLVAGRKMMPNSSARFCTSELKVLPFIAWMRQQCYDEATVYQGIRASESVSRAALPMRQWSDDFDAWIERPLLTCSIDEVFKMHRECGLKPNPLYQAGAERVGCFPCIMTNKSELRRLSLTRPEVWDRIAALEAALPEGRGFFRADFIPARFHTGRYRKWGADEGQEVEGTYPTWQDVRRYVTLADEQQARLFDACSSGGCMSVYNLCE